MKTAQSRLKTSLTLKEVEKRMDEVENSEHEKGVHKIFYPHFVYFSDELKLELMKYGYKVYKGSWDGVINDAIIIEW